MWCLIENQELYKHLLYRLLLITNGIIIMYIAGIYQMFWLYIMAIQNCVVEFNCQTY